MTRQHQHHLVRCHLVTGIRTQISINSKVVTIMREIMEDPPEILVIRCLEHRGDQRQIILSSNNWHLVMLRENQTKGHLIQECNISNSNHTSLRIPRLGIIT